MRTAPLLLLLVALAEAEDALAEVAVAELNVELDEVELGAEDDEEDVVTVALSVPHFSLVVQVCCPSRSLGCAAIHWLNVSWQMKNGRVFS